MKRATTELRLQRYIVDKWHDIFPHWHLIAVNPRISGFCSKRTIGVADFLFNAKGKLCIGELKWGQDIPTDFWGSLKVLGYSKAYELANRKAIPVVFLPKECLTNDTTPILSALKINYVAISRDREGYFFEYSFA